MLPKRVTMADVATYVGVSRALVSLVFRNQEGASAATRERIFAAAEEIGYRPDTAAQLLRRRRSGYLGVVYSARSLFQAELVEAIYATAQRHGYGIVLSATAETRSQSKAIEELLGLRSEAIILIGPDLPQAELDAVTAVAPLVTIGRRLRSDTFDTVRTDDYRGAREAIEHLVQLGHRRISHVDGGSAPGAADRRRGYRATMRRHRLESTIDVLAGDLTEDSGARAARQLINRSEMPTAVFAANDRCAVGLLDTFLRSGIAVPEDVSVIGYDDSPLARLSHIDMTTVRQDVTGLSEAAIAAAVGRLDDNRQLSEHVVLQPSVIQRTTSAKPADKEAKS